MSEQPEQPIDEVRYWDVEREGRRCYGVIGRGFILRGEATPDKFEELMRLLDKVAREMENRT